MFFILKMNGGLQKWVLRRFVASFVKKVHGTNTNLVSFDILKVFVTGIRKISIIFFSIIFWNLKKKKLGAAEWKSSVRAFQWANKKRLLKTWFAFFCTFKFCLRTISYHTTSNYTCNYLLFKLKKIYSIIIFFSLMAFFDTANTNKPTFFWTILVFL